MLKLLTGVSRNTQNIGINFDRHRNSNINRVAQIMGENFMVRSHLK